MSRNRDRIEKRFEELNSQKNLRFYTDQNQHKKVDSEEWQTWATSVMHLIELVFSSKSVHFQNFKYIYERFNYFPEQYKQALGVFAAANDDFSGGFATSLETAVSGEIFADFITLAKNALQEGNKEVAAVLACAALEDSLKKYARSHDLNVKDHSMQQVCNALKSKGLVSGAKKTLLNTMPKIRDYSMHANWEKITAEDIGSVIGFVETFLLHNF